jgi:hypothetical protein
MRQRGRYLRSWAGALEWFVGGAVGVGLAIALQYGLGGPPPWGPGQVVIFVLGFGLAGAALRRWRGGQLVARGRAVLADGPSDGDPTDRREIDGLPDRHDRPGEEFGPPGAGG